MRQRQHHKSSHVVPLPTDDELCSKKIKLFRIAIAMVREKLPKPFVIRAVETAYAYEGVADLLTLWSREDNKKEKEEIISDIQEMIDASEQDTSQTELRIKFNDLDTISKNIRAFKDSLYQQVIQNGGITHLAELTGIPQPSLSRFFNSNAMPRRSTVLKIAKALNLQDLKIDSLYL